MNFVSIVALMNLVFVIACIFLFILIVIALIKYIKTKERHKERHKESSKTMLSLGETLKQQRIGTNMTQEFVAESIGVSRQAVSKWENGTSEPSTSNLIALAKLFNSSVSDLLENVN